MLVLQIYTAYRQPSHSIRFVLKKTPVQGAKQWNSVVSLSQHSENHTLLSRALQILLDVKLQFLKFGNVQKAIIML